MSKINLTEATMLALQGKLQLEEDKEVKEEAVNVSVQDNGSTMVDTDDATINIQEKQPVEEIVEVPVEGEETIIPEEEISEEALEDIIEEPTIDEIVNEDELEESKEVTTENVEIDVDTETGDVEVTTDEGENVEVVDETEEPDESTDEEVENKEVVTEDIEEEIKINPEMTDTEIAKYIAENFEKITGVEIDTIFNNEDAEVPFNQSVIDKTSPAIMRILEDANIEGKRLEEILYKLDDELISIRDTGKTTESKEIKTEDVEVTSDGTISLDTVEDIYTVTESIFATIEEAIGELNKEDISKEKKDELIEKLKELGDKTKSVNTSLNTYMDLIKNLKESKEIKTEASGELSGKLYNYFEEMGYMDGPQGEIINAFIKWLSEDEIKRFAEIYEYPILGGDEEDLDESKKITESTLTYTYEVYIDGLQPVMYSDDWAVNDAKKEYIENEGKGHDISEVKVRHFEEPVEEVIGESGKTKFEGKEESNVYPHCCKEKCKCSKELQYNKDTFTEALNKYFTNKYKAVEGFELTKLLKSDKSIKIEGKLLGKQEKEITLELNKVQEGTAHTKYKLKESTGLLKENKQKEITMMTKIDNNVLECRYIIEK